MPAETTSTPAYRTKTTAAGTFRMWPTGTEMWDDDGIMRETHSFLVEEPAGNTYGYFAADHFKGISAFYERVDMAT